MRFFLFSLFLTEEWSECSRVCGGGVQWRLNDSRESVNRSCNEEACHNETCLQGMAVCVSGSMHVLLVYVCV